MEFRTGYIAIVGRPNVGKSTLLNHLIGQKISITSRKAQTTRHRIVGIRTDADAQYVFVDTPGFQMQHQNVLNRVMNRTVTQSLSDVDVALFVIESMRFDARDEKVLALLPRNQPVVLVINKTDKVSDKSTLLPFIEKVSASFPFAAIIPVSAKRDSQLTELVQEIRRHMQEGEPIYGEDEITDRSERFLAAEIVREKVFRLLGDEIPYSISVEIEKFETEGGMRRVYAAIIVDRDSQKPILIGKKGEKLKEIGTQSRKDMEELFGLKVYLELWVKVKSGWADDERAVKSLGYE
ncbi:GTP-binding protein Era [Sulfuricella denitrificans skB26]|uniref:GTPase Era n=1 Tax=Sulfuricella denitrificans (strain DSM 22764 / NBRC 105220 / skB26) TaxID=1163617 RepID=S6AGT6_SULDS|nr:GTPase Era [Sulfuricella denitrificans]BAN35226.1 GTP-binding protein Era [Sulfuricella denitrificans skB26]